MSEKEPVYLHAYAGPFDGTRKFSEIPIEFDGEDIELIDEDTNISLSVNLVELLTKIGEAVKA